MVGAFATQYREFREFREVSDFSLSSLISLISLNQGVSTVQTPILWTVGHPLTESNEKKANG